MTKLTKFKKGLVGTAALGFLMTGTAFAAGTDAETPVDNTFTLNYEVNGAEQPEINNNANPTRFLVDRLIDLTVENIEGPTTVVSGESNADTIFTVTNDGNGDQAYELTVQNAVAGDDFDPTGTTTLTYYISDGDNNFEPGGDDGAAIAYDPANPPVLGPDEEIIVVVERNIPASLDDADTGDVILVANTLDATAPFAEVEDDSVTNVGAAGNDLLVSENVLNDGTSTGEEVANDGADSAVGVYIVAAANVDGEKTVSIFSEDGTGCATIPGTPASDAYSIPGACVEYRIRVTNNDTRPATAIDVSDTLPDELNFVAAALETGGDFTGGTLNAPTVTDPAAGLDCTSGACVITLTGATLPADDGVAPDNNNSPEGVIIIRALLK